MYHPSHSPHRTRKQSMDVHDSSPLLNFHDPIRSSQPDIDQQMLFGDVDMDDMGTSQYNSNLTTSSSVPFPWLEDSDMKPTYDLGDPSSLSMFDFGESLHSPTRDSGYLSSGMFSNGGLQIASPYENDLYSSRWTDPGMLSSPIPVPSSPADSTPASFHAYNLSPLSTNGAFSPAEFAAFHPLPGSVSPTSSYHENLAFEPQAFASASPPEVSTVQTPHWATSLYDAPPPSTSASRHTRTASSPTNRHSPLGDRTQRLRIPARRGSVSANDIFQSSSAPSLSAVPMMTRPYSSRVGPEHTVTRDDAEGTIRRRRKVSAPEESVSPPDSDTVLAAPLKPVLKPPKLAPSAWQLYFTDWIQREQSLGTRKLNVAQAAKEAGQEYAFLSDEEKEPYKQRSKQLKEARERDVETYMRSLTPDDYKRENAYRTAQRKAGKSRKSNVKDPNAPKKPLSAYFMFLQRIRSDSNMVNDVFGSETETTKQSVLAAAKWRAMTDAERQPFLAQAEHEKMEYEAARRLYEEGHNGYGTTINFSILPNSPSYQSIKVESDSESNTPDNKADAPSATSGDEWKRYIRY